MLQDLVAENPPHLARLLASVARAKLLVATIHLPKSSPIRPPAEAQENDQGLFRLESYISGRMASVSKMESFADSTIRKTPLISR